MFDWGLTIQSYMYPNTILELSSFHNYERLQAKIINDLMLTDKAKHIDTTYAHLKSRTCCRCKNLVMFFVHDVCVA
jgi:hypothetical protein